MSETKTRGQLFYELALRYGGWVPDWNGEPEARRARYEKMAAEYDKARFALPEDVEALVAQVEGRAAHGTSEANVLHLIAIVRAQGAELATYRKDVLDAAGELMVPIPSPGTVASKMLMANRALMRQRDKSDDEWTAERQARLVAESEREALRERVVKLEEQKAQTWWCSTCHVFNRQNQPTCTACNVECPELPKLRERLAKLEKTGREAYTTHNEFRVSTEHSDAIAKLGELVKEADGVR